MIARRELLAGAALSSVALALPAVAGPARSVDLQALIDVHRKADIEYGNADIALAEANDDITDLPGFRIPLGVRPDGTAEGYTELSMMSGKNREDEIRANTASWHQGLRQMHCSSWAKVRVPAYVEEMEAAIDRSERRALAALDEALAEIERRRASSAPLGAAADAAALAERRARLAVALYRPRNSEEAALKAGYLKEASAFDVEGDARCCSELFVTELLAALGEVA